MVRFLKPFYLGYQPGGRTPPLASLVGFRSRTLTLTLTFFFLVSAILVFLCWVICLLIHLPTLAR
jgi:hypothetical protein